MSKQSVILSDNGFKNVLIDKQEYFIFVGENEIKVNRIFAEFVSPMIAHVHRSDPTVIKINLTEHLYGRELNEYEEKIIKSLHDRKVVSSLIEISGGERVVIDNETEKKKLLYLSILLGNEELFDLLETPEKINE